MSFSIIQNIKQTISSQTIQHLEILQFTGIELESYILQKSAENPLLHVKDVSIIHHHEDIMKLATFSSRNSKNSYKKNVDVWQMMLTQECSQEDLIMEQAFMNKELTALDWKILKYLIGCLDERLFLDTNVSEVAKRFHTTENHVEVMLKLLQSFEPCGVGARDYKEYLILQIQHDQAAPEWAATFVQYDLSNVANNAFKVLSKKYGVSSQIVQETLQYIRTLNPVPSVEEYTSTTEYIFPEAIIHKIHDEWVIQLNKYSSNVSIDAYYVTLLKQDPAYKEYYNHCMKDALLLLHGIERREQQLYSILRLFIDIQKPFLEKGMTSLKPMTIKEMANMMGVHDSTISRAIRGKYIRTQHGVFSIQSLFTKGLANSEGNKHAVQNIKYRIKSIIMEEKKGACMSDQQIAEILISEGISISRRTVAKYREEMNILNSAKRMYK